VASWEELSQAKILIVDDDRATIQLFEKMLSRAGYEQISATTDPTAAHDLFQKLRPDLVLLDLHLGPYDGMEVLREIHEEIPAESYLPILVISGDASEQAKLRALVLGAKDFITKPIDIVETMLRIRILLETRFNILDKEREIEELRSRLARKD
jgi:DNA-binding response OmpR family regulator